MVEKGYRFLRLVALAICLFGFSLGLGCGGGPRQRIKETAKLKLREVQNIRYWSNPEYTRVVFYLDGEATYRPQRIKDPDRIYVDISPAWLSSSLQGKTFSVGDGILKQIRTARHEAEGVRVVLDLDTVEDYRAFALDQPFRIIVDIRGRLDFASPSGEAIRPNFPEPGSWKVVLDPGHGGKDPGAIGPKGLEEKEVVLDIARRLQKLLQKAGWQVVLTRRTDVYLSLGERTAIANREKATLFISLHANASSRSRAKGIETYFLNPRYNGKGESVVIRENGALPKGMDKLQNILYDLKLTSNLQESGRLADMIQSSLVRSLKKDYPDIVDLGVKQAPFYVLVGAQMPSVLVEISFLSHPGEEARLSKKGYRDRISGALWEGIERYRSETQERGIRAER